MTFTITTTMSGDGSYTVSQIHVQTVETVIEYPAGGDSSPAARSSAMPIMPGKRPAKVS